ncbi:MAG: hypothetical protein BWY78_00456 [Alphaproteobacteria bacterium ADurb.Bin438]|nr:MAG: hypothetical protein BWY78_00456 [Alphaproteobacteria bacterium ADurb.Bin438]
MTNIQVVFDILIICLLFPAIIYMILLNQRIKTLRGQKEDFLKLIAVFNEVTAKAESSLSKIKAISEVSGKNLKELVDQANSLREDLAFMNDKAVVNVENLEKMIRDIRMEEISIKTGAKPSKVATYGSLDEGFDKKISLNKNVPNPKPKGYNSDVDEDVLAAIKVAKNVASRFDKPKSEDDKFLFDIDDEHTEIERELIRDVFMNIHKKEE